MFSISYHIDHNPILSVYYLICSNNYKNPKRLTLDDGNDIVVK